MFKKYPQTPEKPFISHHLSHSICKIPRFMATTRLNSSCHFPACTRIYSESYLGLRTTARISYARTLTAPRGYLAVKANGCQASVVTAAAITEKQQKKYPGESKGFVEEMRFVAMKLHTKDQAREGEKESKSPEEGPVAKWEPTVEGYLQFLVDSKLVYDTLEGIIDESNFPTYAGFKNTGLERAESLRKDLKWFKEQGYEIPEPMAPGKTYSEYLKDLAENDPQAFICHFYNIYFAHSAGGQMIGTKISEKILHDKELEFYKWDGQLSQLLQNVRQKLNKIAECWTREEKNHCLEETEKSFKFSGEILRLILS